MKRYLKIFLSIFVLCSQAVHAQLTSKGVDYFINICSKDDFYKQSLENVRRYQNFEKNARIISNDKVTVAKIVKEKIYIEEDEVFSIRRHRNAQLLSQDEILKFKIVDMSYDVVRTSSLFVFSEFRTGGEDKRILRRLHETCLDVVNKLIATDSN